LDKAVNFATSKINEANAVIEANGLNFKPTSDNDSGGNKTPTPPKEKPSPPPYESGSLADLEA
jgi:hypothetical protein